MKPDYKNWVPKSMVAGLFAGTAAAFGLFLVLGATGLVLHGTARLICALILGAGTLVLLFFAIWMLILHRTFDYNGKRKLSKTIIDGTAAHVTLPEGGVGLDVGCGSGALTIACAKRNPQGTMVGLDRWGRDYASFSRALCERNAQAEGTENVRFRKGDAVRLDLADESFDAVTSNYVYHNIPCADRQALLRETLRVLKKGGTFAIHDIMSPRRYGDMAAFAEELRRAGYARVELIDTTRGLFMSPREARRLGLSGSMLLAGRK